LEQYLGKTIDLSLSPNVAGVDITYRHQKRYWESTIKRPKFQKGETLKPRLLETAKEAKDYIEEALRNRKIASTPQNPNSSRSHTSISLLIANPNGIDEYGRVTFVDLAGKEEYPTFPSDKFLDVQDKTQVQAIHNAITKSLGEFQTFIRCLADNKAQTYSPDNVECELAKGSSPLRHGSPLIKLLKLGFESRRSHRDPLATSTVVIGHVSTEQTNSAQSKGTLEWLHECRWCVAFDKKKEEAKRKPKPKPKKPLYSDTEKAQKWEDFARLNVDDEACDDFAESLCASDAADE